MKVRQPQGEVGCEGWGRGERRGDVGEGGEVKRWGERSEGGGDVRPTQQGQNTAIHWSSKHKYMMQLAPYKATDDLNNSMLYYICYTMGPIVHVVVQSSQPAAPGPALATAAGTPRS